MNRSGTTRLRAAAAPSAPEAPECERGKKQAPGSSVERKHAKKKSGQRRTALLPPCVPAVAIAAALLIGSMILFSDAGDGLRRSASAWTPTREGAGAGGGGGETPPSFDEEAFRHQRVVARADDAADGAEGGGAGGGGVARLRAAGGQARDAPPPASKANAAASPPAAVIAASTENKKSGRKFVSYTASQWEKLWLTNIGAWEKDKSICERILSAEQEPYRREFLSSTCTFRPEISDSDAGSDWCLVDSADGAMQTHWINTNTLEMVKDRPVGVREPTPADLASQRAFRFVSSGQALPENDAGEPRVFSKLIFLDENTGKQRVEYIEPLVSHLRHPLAKCVLGESLMDSPLVSSRAYVVPPPKLQPGTVAQYYDAGASQWAGGGGLGGPSMSYFADMWRRYGIEWTHIEGWEGRGSEERFMQTVPEEYKARIHYHQQWISSDPKDHSEQTPFVPFVMKDNAAKASEGGTKDVYVLFKLDIDAGDVEKGNVDYILDPDNDAHVDELLWEHHVQGNYLMRPNWKKTAARGVTLEDSYQLFLALRRRGIRAHSWV